MLHDTLIGNQIVLSWPVSYTNFILEMATDLGLPFEWRTNPNPAVISGGQFVVTNWIDSARGFYRIKR
jgi:hypothetical protein